MVNPVIMKFGGAALATTDSFSQIANIICERKKENSSLVVVVSAMAKQTDTLLDLAKSVHSNPPERELDMLLSVGERISMALLAMALKKIDVNAVSFTGSQSGIITNSIHNLAVIVDVKPNRIIEQLLLDKVVIVAGFQGMSRSKEITTLGRGGSDTTAVALGVSLGSEKIEFYKDVAGVYDEDPKLNPKAQLLSKLSFIEAFEMASKGAKILHPRCIALANKNGLPLHVLSFKNENSWKTPGTIIKGGDRVLRPIYEE